MATLKTKFDDDRYPLFLQYLDSLKDQKEPVVIKILSDIPIKGGRLIVLEYDQPEELIDRFKAAYPSDVHAENEERSKRPLFDNGLS